MRFRTPPRTPARRKRGPLAGPSSSASTLTEWGGSDAQSRRGDGRGEAEEQQEGGGETVEDTFESRERHDTHLSV